MVVADGDAIEFLVVNVDQFPSHVQAFQGNLDLEEGQSYTFSCQLKASSNRGILLTAKIDKDDWQGIGLHEDLQLTPKYQRFEFTFRMTDSVRS